MSQPLRYIPDGGALVEITINMIQGRYLLRPDKRGRVNELVLGVVGKVTKLLVVNENATSPSPSVVTSSESRKVWASPKPLGSQAGLSKNSMRYSVECAADRLPSRVVVPPSRVAGVRQRAEETVIAARASGRADPAGRAHLAKARTASAGE